MAIEVSEIVSQYGDYYKKGQNNRSRLFAKMTAPSETLAIPGIRHIKTDETVYEAANVTQGSVIQAYQHNFTPKGDTAFIPNVIPLHKMKVDLNIEPDAIEDNWMGFLAGDTQKLKEWPIIRYIMEELVAGKIVEERELYMVYKGIAAAPTPNTAGAVINAMDGLRRRLQLATAAGHSYPAHVVEGLGILSESDIFDQVEAFEDAIPGWLKNQKMVICVAPEMATAYFRRLRALGFYDVKNADGLSMNVDKTNHTLMGLASMTGTTDIFCTIPQNILHIVKRSSQAGQFNVQEDKRDVCILGHWYEGVGFEDNNLVFTTKETVQDTVATPVISNSGNNVTMSCATASSTIRYTTDGNVPTEESSAYSSTITITETTTFKAKAFKEGMNPSAMATKKVTKV